MIKRTIDISTPARLRMELGQVVIEREGMEAARVPCEDVGMMLVDQQRVVYSHAVMTRLMEQGACVVLCGEDHLPCGVVLPVEGNGLLTQRLRKQVAVSRPLEKRIWQQLVGAKVRMQARNLEAAAGIFTEEEGKAAGAAARLLWNLEREVLSGDPTNVEGQAARAYWPGMLGRDFRRARGGAWPNALLNYGYMVVRAGVARAIAGAGLHPSFGVHHRNRGNAFCLADDLMEPLRPLVDAAVLGLMGRGTAEVTPEAKRTLLGLLAMEVDTGEGEDRASGPLMVQIERMATSLWGCYAGERGTVELPVYKVGGFMDGWTDADG